MSTSKPVTELQLPGFDIYTRDSYFKKFGKPAPSADPTKRAKAWIGSGTFFFLDGLALKQQTVPATENDVNIEGAGPFQPYVIAPSGAWSTLNGTKTTQYNPLYLSLQSDAQALMTELGGSNLIDAGANPFSPLAYDPTEARREWEFTDQKGIVVNVGALLFIRNMQGVGAPGHWDQSGTAPTWIADNPMPNMSQAPWGPPCRALAANESIQGTGLFNMATLIVDDGTPDPGAPTAGGYTQADRNRDEAVYSLVKRIASEGLRLPL